MESILTYTITVWFGVASAEDRTQLDKVVPTASRIIIIIIIIIKISCLALERAFRQTRSTKGKTQAQTLEAEERQFNKLINKKAENAYGM